jgi:ribonucleoside-diphosphate reductase alpha chain
MMSCKSSADWFARKPHLQYANNSAALLRSLVQREQFMRVFGHTKKFGEPGFSFVVHYDCGLNPCAEVGFYPVLEENGEKRTGWAFCNLTSINAAMLRTERDFMEAARAATLIGTLQASYTDFPYLGEVSEKIARRDALIGVSMTGMQDSPAIALDPRLQRRVASHVKLWNETFATALGINSAARTTVVKPEGTGTLTLLCNESPSIGAGIHPHEDRRYIRRVTASDNEVVFQKFREVNPEMCRLKPDGNWVIEFPIKAGDQATLIDDQTAVEFLAQVRSTQQNWVVPGTARDVDCPGLHNNVSCTVATREHEWSAVAEYLWEHRDDFTAVSFLPRDVTKVYAFAPYEAVKTAEQDRRWRELAGCYTTVDYTSIREDEDNTTLRGEAACAGGQCEWAA